MAGAEGMKRLFGFGRELMSLGNPLLTLVVGVRSAFFVLLLFAVSRLIDFGTATALLAGSAVVGVWGGTRLSVARFRTLGVLSVFVLLGVLFELFYFFLQYLPLPEGHTFLLVAWSEHARLMFLIAVLAFSSTWAFWRYRNALSWEVIFLAAISVSALSLHRNYRFDLVPVLARLSWTIGLSPLITLIVLGTLLFLVLTAYLTVGGLVPRVIVGRLGGNHEISRGIINPLSSAFFTVVVVAFLLLVSFGTYKIHNQSVLTAVRNGVGDEAGEGMSPLSFQSALGSSNQPAALVRLEGDYAGNPFSPMLYLREAALSKFSGVEMVQASSGFDRDVPLVSPEESYSRKEELSGIDDSFRREVVQSVYLLTKHKLSFAIDYPENFIRLKNPEETTRFVTSFRARSAAPEFQLENIKTLPVGSSSWSEGEWAHYTQKHSDTRYESLAHSIVDGIQDPVEKALALTSYLSKEAIYTLSPNHQVDEGQDAVAAFLFGDLRGYCVHFAHATVYMLRALGIPARVATGYLTDFSQAKDGHILLRMSDRHAWAEVYVRDIGWVPFDTTPEQVESHAETPVDMKLLEELMGMIGPGEEILDPKNFEDEAGLKEEEQWQGKRVGSYIAFLLILIALSAALLKLYLYNSWKFASHQVRRLEKFYFASLSRLRDVGYERRIGETRQEFQHRLVEEMKSNHLLQATPQLLALLYSPESQEGKLRDDFSFEEELLFWKTLPLRTRILMWLNPRSIVAFLGGRKW